MGRREAATLVRILALFVLAVAEIEGERNHMHGGKTLRIMWLQAKAFLPVVCEHLSLL